ncbi:MAG TPA: hypothetical protein PKY35_05665 [Candidatus Hydrogenedentes bacterium]|nr:hypothetical protein [Candidatus Hydrogenedentota bacterium]HOL76499.1 hypothetical protein [Candidatus Hydrogenedentota bacterium]HPO85164.1 hypothetical protein [Candidatus Hydrogenedentota bacterium]
MKRRVVLWGIYALPVLLLVILLGCPPLRFEDVYGYNTVVMRNRGDRPLLALFVIKQGQPGRGMNYIEELGGLPPNENLVVPGLLNGVYNLEIEYMLTASEVYEGIPRRVVERMPGVSLYWGNTYSWYWYGPSDQILSDAMQPPAE